MAKKKPSKRLGVITVSQEKEHEADLLEVSAKAAELDKAILKLNEENQKELGEWLSKRLTSAKNSKEWTETKDRIRRIRKAYEEGVQRTNTEMKGSHDYRTWLAASQADSMKARLLNIFSVDPLVKLEGRNAQGRMNAPHMEQFLDYHHDVNVNLAAKGDEICGYITQEGHCVLYSPWTLQIDQDSIQFVEKQVFVDGDKKERLVDLNSPIQVSAATADGFVAKSPPEYKVEDAIIPEVIKNHPDVRAFSLLDYLNPKGSKPSMDTRPAWEAIQLEMTLDELMAMEEEGKVFKGTVKKLKTYFKENPGTDVGEKDNRGADRPGDLGDAQLEKDALDSKIKYWVVWGAQKIPGYKRLQKAITLIHMDSELVFQTRLHPYVGKGNPFFHLRLIQANWRFPGIGVMEMGMPGEQAITDLANYVLDEGRIMSCLPYKYNKQRFPGGLSPFEFWKGVPVRNMNDFQSLEFRDRRPMDLNVATFVRGNMERRTGQGDLQLGRESDVTGKQPPTARGVVSIIREGQVRFTALNFTVIAEIVRLAGHECMLFQQYLGDKVPVEILGPDGTNLFPHGISRRQILGSFKYIPNMIAQNMVRELDAELNFLLYDKFKDNPFIAQSLSSFYNMTRDTIMSTGKKNNWLKPLNFYTKAAGRIDEGGVSLSPEEQQFVEELLNAGIPMAEVQSKLQELRSGGTGGGEPPPTDDSESKLLLGEGEVEE